MKKTYLNLSFNNTEFHSTALKFRNLSGKIDALLSTGKFWEYSKSQQQHLLSKLRRLFEKLSGFDLKYAMKIAGAALCFTMISGSAKAIPTFQDFNPNNPFDYSEIFGVEVSPIGLPIYDGAFGDINGDGSDDAILLTGCGAAYFEYDEIGKHFEERTGNVNPFRNDCGSYYISAYGLDMGDLDGDGLGDGLDAVTIGSGWLYHYKLIDGKFEIVSGSDINDNHQSGNPYGTQVKFGDVDGDGDLDIVATYCSTGGTHVYSLIQQSDHSFSRSFGFPVCGPISSGTVFEVHINLADMDGDGDDDLFVFTEPNLDSPALAAPSSGPTNPSYYQNNSPASGPFSLVTSGVPLPLADMSGQDFPLLADLDDDGDIDVFTPGNSSGGFNFQNLGGNASAVPIPPLVALLAFAATGFGIFRRNRKKKTE